MPFVTSTPHLAEVTMVKSAWFSIHSLTCLNLKPDSELTSTFLINLDLNVTIGAAKLFDGSKNKFDFDSTKVQKSTKICCVNPCKSVLFKTC